MGKKKVQEYVPEALEHFKKCMELIRRPNNEEQYSSKLNVDIQGLQKAVRALPKADREKVEKFWGLTGGPNHSKKIANREKKDIAYNEMASEAITSLRKMFALDYLNIYDPSVNMIIEKIRLKVNKQGVEISDTEMSKILMAFFIYADNGPKMAFETDPMTVDTELNGSFGFDEYEVLEQMCQELQVYPDNSINLKLLINFFETMNFNDMLSIKKSMNIEIKNYFKDLQVIKKNIGMEYIKDFGPEDIETIRTISSIRQLKERLFPYGGWEVTSALIFGNVDGKVNLSEFFETLTTLRNDWGKFGDFKVRQKQLRVAGGIRTLNVYNIGGLEFTDIAEVMFLYAERNLIYS